MGNEEAAKEKEQERGKGKMGNDEAKGTTLTFKTGRFWLYLCETVRFEFSGFDPGFDPGQLAFSNDQNTSTINQS